MKILLFLCWVVLSQATENVHNKIYTTLTEAAPCVLRLNGSRIFGCTSQRGGSVGVIHLAYDQSSLDWVLNNSTRDAYVVTLNVKMFTMDNLKKLNESSVVSGVLLVQKENRSDIESFSPESRCPNRYSGLADAAHDYSSDVCPASSPWNPDGNEIAMQFWRIPMFFIDNEETIGKIEMCFNDSNIPLSDQTDRALCALELASYMFAAGDSTKCLSRSYPSYNVNPIRLCDPLADKNTYAPAIPFEKFSKTEEGSYILVAARADSTSLFLGRATGALSTATSMVALFLTSNVLSRLLQLNSSTAKKNVLFVLLHGEAYDYIGSQKLVYDMELGEFPYREAALKLDDVGLFIELSQLLHAGAEKEPLTYHTYKNSTRAEAPIIEEFATTFKKIEKEFRLSMGLNELPSSSSYPPSSYQSFLARKAVPGFVLASYRTRFHNQFYHSLYDDAHSVGYKFANGSKIDDNSLQAFIANFSTVLGHTLFSLMTGIDGAEQVKVTYEEADKILNCYVDSMACDFFTHITGSQLDNYHFDYYVGVSQGTGSSHMSVLSVETLRYLTGRNVSASNRDECLQKRSNNPYTYSWVASESRCLESYVNSTLAISPAFINATYELHEGIYSSWTESSWSATHLRMFHQPSPKYERIALTIGCAVLVASFSIVYWIRSNSRELFNFPHLIATSSI